MATTTDILPSLWYYRPFNSLDPLSVPLEVADQHSHLPVGFGFLCIPSSDPSGHTMVFCLFTPSLPATIVSPFSIGLQFHARGYSCVSDFDSCHCSVTLHSRNPDTPDVSFPQRLLRGLLFSLPVLFPSDTDHKAPPPPTLDAVFPF